MSIIIFLLLFTERKQLLLDSLVDVSFLGVLPGCDIKVSFSEAFVFSSPLEFVIGFMCKHWHNLFELRMRVWPS